MYMDYIKFEEVMVIVVEVFVIWDENMKDFINVVCEGIYDGFFYIDGY